MSKGFEKEIKYIRRNYLMSMNLIRVVTWWALIVVLFFGFFGIRPLGKVIIDKLKLISEMKTLNESLEKNLVSISAASESLSSTGSNLVFLFAYVPKTPAIHDYLIELLDTASAAGFSIKTYTPFMPDSQSVENTKVQLSVKFEGNGDPVELVDKIEKLKRVTKVTDVKLTPGDFESPTKIDAALEVYYFEEKLFEEKPFETETFNEVVE